MNAPAPIRRCLYMLMLVCVAVPAAAQSDLEYPERPEQYPDVTKDRVEFGLFPLLGGDSDYGLALGSIGSVADFKPYARPYLWRLEASGIVTLKNDQGLKIPYQDYYVKFTAPAFLDNTLSISWRLAYTYYSTLHYWGLGNASTQPAVDSPLGSRYNEYQLGYPHATFELAQKASPLLFYKLAIDYFYERPEIYAGSRLDEDMQADSELVGRTDANLVLLSGTFGIDTRDNDLAPQRGHYDTVAVRYSPKIGGGLPYDFVGINVALRGYINLGTPYLVLAGRLVGDGLVGQPPFYMLAESADGYALGGGSGVRGVPAQRYYGKVKVYGSAELRLSFPSHQAFDQEIVWGLAAFADAGRLWADWHSNPQLDGTGIGLKYGVGGGIRLRFGTTFLVRGDVAYSPDASPVSFYLTVGHAF